MGVIMNHLPSRKDLLPPAFSTVVGRATSTTHGPIKSASVAELPHPRLCSFPGSPHPMSECGGSIKADNVAKG